MIQFPANEDAVSVTTSVGAALWAADIESKTSISPAQVFSSHSAGTGNDAEDVTLPRPMGRKEL